MDHLANKTLKIATLRV